MLEGKSKAAAASGGASRHIVCSLSFFRLVFIR